jgi:carnitine 3-dehydrogenase
LTDVPDLDDDLVDLIANQSDAQSGHLSIRQLERLRDDNLVGILRALKLTGSGAGGVITDHEGVLPEPDLADLPVTVRRRVPQTWTDYNGHMTESTYLEVSAQASDRFMELIGADATYIAAGNSYFTAETHFRFLGEVKEGDELSVATQVLAADGKKLHLFHRLIGPGGDLAATSETLLLHMDLKTRRTSLPLPAVAAAIADYVASHAGLPLPDGVRLHVKLTGGEALDGGASDPAQ